uniref:phosphoinositide 5-phosphatase n=1 Tax=Strigamia maritima TaxID=126957 RepID=T1IVI5_STRMM
MDHVISAGLVEYWVKSTRILALVEYQNEFGLFVFSTSNSPSYDVELDRVFPIDGNFKFETELVVQGTAVYLKLSYEKQKYLFEISYLPETCNFTTELTNAIDEFSRQTNPPNFTWLHKYTKMISVSKNPFAGDVFDPFKDGHAESSVELNDVGNQVQLKHIASPAKEKRPPEPESPDSFKGLPRESIAMGATPLAARDTMIRLNMTMREEDYTNVYTLKIFIGTWNVNGQPPSDALTDWLVSSEDPPDIYAVGFQELDLSKEAFLFSDSPREDEWFQIVKKGLHPKARYHKLKLIRLVGMMLIVFIQEKHFADVTNVVAETVGTGIMGKMGNKGGVAVRLDLHNTSLCFVNSHLAAHAEECERRNQDFNDICARMIFNQFTPPKSIRNHDHIYWLGDLNYRIVNLDVDLVKTRIKNEQYLLLMENDQLSQQRNLKKVFVGFEEGQINFPPTYKYDPGTDNWDTSDKCRTPAWCDRVLWRGPNIKLINYRSSNSLRVSDHKPVSCTFASGIKVVDVAEYRKIYEEVMKKLDKLENEFLPQVAVDSTEITFEKLRFIEPQFRYLTIANTGQVPVQFEFIKKLNDSNYCKEWLKIKPYTAFIKPGEKCDIELEVHIDKYTVSQLSRAEDKIYDILVLHLDGGKDIFISFKTFGTYEPTCFGISLEQLVQMKGFILQTPVEKLIDLDSDYSEDVQCDSYDIPKEIWLLVHHLCKHALHQAHLFEQPGLHSEIQQIRSFLDTGVPNTIPGSCHSVAECLLLFLEALPEPVIPFSFYTKCLENANNYMTCKQLLAEIPVVHQKVFKYLMFFLRELLSHSEKNKLDNKTITTLFGSTLIRAPPVNSDPKSRIASSQQVDRKKATFIYHFLVNDYDG